MTSDLAPPEEFEAEAGICASASGSRIAVDLSSPETSLPRSFCSKFFINLINRSIYAAFDSAFKVYEGPRLDYVGLD